MPRTVIKATLCQGYQTKLLEEAIRRDPRDPQLSKVIASILEGWVDEKIKSGEMSPITEQDIADERNLSVESFFRRLRRRDNP